MAHAANAAACDGCLQLLAPRPPSRQPNKTPIVAKPLSVQLQLLARLDDPLVEVLRRGDIRLLSMKWLRENRRELDRMPRRQDLEKRFGASAASAGRSQVAPSDGRSPFVPETIAVELLRASTRPPHHRRILALSYGWLTRDHPDPAGERLRDVLESLDRMIATGVLHSEEEYGIFWE